MSNNLGASNRNGNHGGICTLIQEHLGQGLRHKVSLIPSVEDKAVNAEV